MHACLLLVEEGFEEGFQLFELLRLVCHIQSDRRNTIKRTQPVQAPDFIVLYRVHPESKIQTEQISNDVVLLANNKKP